MMPRVTVLVPTYNYAEFLATALTSVLGQTFGDFELLVLDNASTDATPEVIAGFTDRRLRVLRNPATIGWNANVTLGFELARGEFVAVIGADDEWDPGFLAHAVARLEADPGLAFVHGRAVWIDEAGVPFGDSAAGWLPVTLGPMAFVDCFVRGFSLTTMLMRTALVRRVGGFHRAWDEIADTWLFLLLCLEGDVGYIDSPLVRFRVHGRSLTTSWSRQGRGFRQHLALVRAAFELPEVRARGFAGDRRRALRAVVASTVAMLHVIRTSGTYGAYFAAYRDVLAAAPEVGLRPLTWARFALGLLPASWMRGLRRWKRDRWRTGAGLPAAPAVAPR